MKVQNIWGVGRNYLDHAKELGNKTPSEPIIFLKSASCLVEEHEEIKLPEFSKDIHHEIEIAIKLNQNLEPSEMTLAIDFTARDIQNRLKSEGLPWTLAKSFPCACPIGKWIPYKKSETFKFSLSVNGELRQHGHTADMVFSIDKIVKYLTDHFPVQPGDIILTGTPSGVARISAGDRLESEIEGYLKAFWNVKNKENQV